MFEKEEEIIRFVEKAFDGKRRKKEDLPLSSHSLIVGMMLKNIGCDEDTVYIGYLHDIIEDTAYTYEDVLSKFGLTIAEGISYLSEDKSIENYMDRKSSFIQKLEYVPENILMVELADKLSNLLSDYASFEKDGCEALSTKKADYDTVKWYYTSLQELFNKRLLSNKLLDRYNNIISLYFPKKYVKIKAKKTN